MMPGLMPVIGGSAPLELTHIESKGITGNVTTINFGDYTMPRDGLMIILFLNRSDSNPTVSSVSIGGSNGTLHVAGSGSNNKVAIASRVVAAGARNVSVTLSGSAGSNNCHVCTAWCLTGNLSNTPTDTASSVSVGGTSKSLTLNINGGGFAIYGTCPKESNTPTVTWSTATHVDNRTVNSRRFVTANKIPVAATITGHVETVTWDTSTTTGQVGASWR